MKIDNPMAFSTSLAWIASLLSTNGIGWIYDATHSYQNSAIMMCSVAIAGVFLNIVLYKLDAQQT